MEDYARQVEEGRALVSIRLPEFLKRWLVARIQGADRQFGKYEAARQMA